MPRASPGVGAPGRIMTTSEGIRVMTAPPAQANSRASTARTLLRGTSWSAAAQLIPLVVNLAMTPWVIHGLGAGRYSVFLLVSTLVSMLGTLDGGIGQSALRFFTIYAGRDDRVATTRLLFSVSVIVAVGALAVTAAVLALAGWLLDFFRLDPDLRREAWVLLVVLVPVTGVLLLRNLYSSIVYARQHFGTMSMALLAGYASYTIGLVITVLQGWGLYGLAGALIVQGLVVGSVSVPVGLRYLDRAGLRLMSRAEFGEFFGYAWRVQVSGLLTFIGYQKDQLVAGRLLSAQLSGPFGQGTSFATQLAWMPQNAVGPIQALIGQRVGADGAPAAARTAESVQRLWVKAVVGWCAVGAPAAYVGVRAWLPDSFALAGTVAAMLLLGNMCWLMARVLVLWGLALGNSGLEMRGTIAGLTSNVTLSLALYAPFGMLGIVAATALSKVVQSAYVSWDARRSLPTRLRWFVRDVPWVAAAVALGACAAIELALAPHLPRGALGLLGAGLAAAPVAASYVLLAFTGAERRQLRAGVRRRRHR